MGFRTPVDLDITEYNPINDYRNRSLRNMMNLKAECETMQGTMAFLKLLLGWVSGNCDVQMVSNKQNAAGDKDVFQFTGDNIMGLDFEHFIGSKKRSTKLTLQRAMEYEDTEAFLALANEAEEANLGTGEGIDATAYRSPRYGAFEYPTGAPIFPSKFDIIERSLSIKTKGEPSDYNISGVSWLTFSLAISGKDSSIAKIVSQMGKNMTDTLIFTEKNSGANYDKFQFASGILTQKNEFKIGDSNRYRKVIFEGDVPIHDVDFQFGADKGGAAEDTGKLGGTMIIG
jgi:hypothetical protein